MLEILLFFVWGFFVKLTDDMCDKPRKVLSKARFVFAAIYGITAGFAVSISAEFSAVVIAMVLGVLLAGKIDAKAHLTGIAFIFGSALLFGVVPPSYFLVFLLAAAFLDEMVPVQKKIKNKNLKSFFAARPLLPLTALIVSFAAWNANYFLAVLLFDAAYRIAAFAYQKSFYFANFSKKL